MRWIVRAAVGPSPLLLLMLLMIWGCGRSGPKQVVAAKPATAATAAAATTSAATAAAAIAKPPPPPPIPSAARRERRPTIIGGCDERCETPQLAAAAFFDALQTPKPTEAMHQLVDWSLLEWDGDRRGDRWGDMWADHRQHAARAAEISTWLNGWINLLQQAKPAALLRSRAQGVQFKPIAGRTDVVEMRWRHPPLAKGGGEREWRILWTRRGYEWLISRIDRTPSSRPIGSPTRGGSREGHL